MHILALLALAVVAAPASAVGPPARYAPAAPVTTVPLEVMRSRHIAVQVKLNGKGPYRMVLDTGSPVTFISIPLAEDLGLIGKVTDKAASTLFRLPTTVDTVDVGGVTVKDLSVLILNHPTIQLLSQVEGPIHGIVGFSFFARFKITLDYQAAQATFEPSDYKPEDVLQSLMAQVMGGGQERKVLAPAGVWGIVLDPVASLGGSGVVSQVLPRSAAAEAGLLPGDHITEIDGRWVASVPDAFDAASHVAPGAAAEVKLVRGGKPMAITVRPRSGI